MSAVHVLPVGDLIEHESNDDCVCGPQPIYVDGEKIHGWVMAHASLDGREFAERRDED